MVFFLATDTDELQNSHKVKYSWNDEITMKTVKDKQLKVFVKFILLSEIYIMGKFFIPTMHKYLFPITFSFGYQSPLLIVFFFFFDWKKNKLYSF